MAAISRRALAIAAAAGLVVASGACRYDSSSPQIGRGGSAPITAPDGAGVVERPAAYQITYRVEELVDGRVVAGSAVLLVRRPFDSRLERRDLTVSDAVASIRVAGLGVLAQSVGSERAVLRHPAPAPAPGDVRADLIVGSAPGLLGDRREWRRVLGRACQVVRSGAPLLSGEIVPAPAPEAHVDSCLSAEGLVLEEVSSQRGTPTARWVATAVDLQPDVDDARFSLPGAAEVPAGQGGGSVKAVDPTSRSLGTFWELDGPAAGFTPAGRYAVVPPQAATASDPASRPNLVAAVVDVWTRGPDIVLVDQGGTLGQVPPFAAHRFGHPADLGALGQGEWFLTPAGPEVRVLLPPGRYVRVAGTLPVEDLLALARRLRPVQGDGLRPIAP